MYSPDNQGDYVPKVGTLNLSIQGLSDTLTALETVTKVQPPPEESVLQPKVTMPMFNGMRAWYYMYPRVILP